MFVCFFQAEDGIRDIGVTGVQTCALPIFEYSTLQRTSFAARRSSSRARPTSTDDRAERSAQSRSRALSSIAGSRSEERRVGKECRSRWSQYHSKKKKHLHTETDSRSL